MSNAETRVMTRKRWFVLLGLWALGIGVVLMVAGVAVSLMLETPPPILLKGLFPVASVCLICGTLWLVMTPWMSNDPVDPAHRRYMRQVLPAFGGYMLAMVLLKMTYELDLPVWGRALLAMLPVLPIIWVVRSIWDYIQRCDELERRVQIESIYLTCGIVGVVTFAGGMLQHMHVLELKGALLHVLPLMFLTYGAVGWVCRRKYGLKGMC